MWSRIIQPPDAHIVTSLEGKMLVVFIMAIYFLRGLALSLQHQTRDAQNHQNFHILDSLDLDLEGQCGYSKLITGKLEPRILGGSNAELGEFPWMVLIFYKRFIHFAYHDYPECGGSLVSSRLVLTAAHCLSRADAISYVRVGEYDRSSPVDCRRSRCAPEPVDVYDLDTIVHDQYDSHTRLNDIGLIRLKTKLTFNEFVRPACLPLAPQLSSAAASEFEGKALTVAGWGHVVTKPTPVEARVLQRMAVDVLPDAACNVAMTSHAFAGSPTQACFGGPAAERAACLGDAGDPILYADPTTGGQWQMGVVSFSSPECKRGWQYLPYTVFTWIPHYITWILDHMDDD